MTLRSTAILAVISIIAAFAAWVPVAASVETGGESIFPENYTLRFLPVALAGSCGIGFPVALVAYMLARQQLARSFTNVLLVALLSSVMIALTSLVFFDASAAFIFGVPSLFAALTYAILGWVWLLVPIREGNEQ